jgi:hypothetical protein
MMGRILGNGLTRAAESEQRELELSFWAELLPEGDQVFPTMMAYFLPPTTRREDNAFEVVINDITVKVCDCYDFAQVHIWANGMTVGIRRTTTVSGCSRYILRFKCDYNGGGTGLQASKLETEVHIERNEGFSAFNMMARQCGNVLYFTRMEVDVEAANISYEIDIPLMSGEHTRDYDAVHMKFVKIDVERVGGYVQVQAQPVSRSGR